MKKKILYLFSDTGGGHRSAATALIKAVDELKPKDPPIQEMVDVFAECSGFLNLFAKLYGPVIKYSPKMWGMLYYWLNDTKKMGQLEKMSRPFIEKELAKLIQKRKPDLIVSVHPLLNHISISAMEKAGHRAPLITVVTDPVSFHRTWICPEAQSIIVATEEAREQALEYGGAPSKIKVIGLPIDPRFAKPAKDRSRLMIDMGLNPKKFTVLLMGGGEGGGGMLSIVKEIVDAGLDLQMMVIAGRNEKLKKTLEKMAVHLRFKLKVFGFTNEVPDIMTASDVVITKAGPGSIAEALSKDLPLIITSWLPGQEEGNVKYVIRHGIGMINRDFKMIGEVIREFQSPSFHEKIKKNIKKVSDPKAVFKIAKEILEAAYRK